ncbi:hypothetical protein IQ264_03105 [Phormidium sp. LEGE 05292]|uniref:hypothetical protein n=1 Tax=[Phormidium] sp. LEGE 05292 TaxID=767427 RepID=UPI0018814DF5|nr:hypothetical protein [Phormidium sp. LEGE 05292]MBE9224463.1 hypothetical protein [Phormidium sp. LEGE 05292]
MATDYILFVHGVNTRQKQEQPTYADQLFRLIQQGVDSSITLKKITLYWGDINQEAQDNLVKSFKQSSAWNQLWFKDFRTNQLLQFAGDAALYLSRTVGYQVVQRLKEQALKGIQGYNPQEDRLHLVTHSWGTVILFDILFAERWNFDNVPGHQDVIAIRNFLFGLPPTPNTGIRLASINTMGSPIALFNLIHVNGSSHDFQPILEELLKNLYNFRGRQLPWTNFIHPGDPVAWPLETVLFDSVAEQKKYLDLIDFVNKNEDWSDRIFQQLSQKTLALIHGGDAHGSYWQSKQVADKIVQTIKAEVVKAKTQASNPIVS